MKIREYNRQQLEAFQGIRNHLATLSRSQLGEIKRWIKSYLGFRSDVEAFQKKYLSETCTRKCFTSRASACCGREGIATFFADVVINVLLSSKKDLDLIVEILLQDRGGFKCVYLKESGCVWQLKPIVCEMFLCKHAKESVLASSPPLAARWERLRRREKQYTWPTRPVLFDKLEAHFLRAGMESPLMYLHRSPGLLRLKEQSQKSRPRN